MPDSPGQSSDPAPVPARRSHSFAPKIRAFRLLAAGSALAILLWVGWVASDRLDDLAEADRLENHSQQVLLELEQLFSDLVDAESAQRGYILSGDERHLKTYDKAVVAVEEGLAAVRRLTADEPEQQKELAALDAPIREKLAGMERNVSQMRNHGFEAARASVEEVWGKGYMARIREGIAALQSEEQRLLARRHAAKAADIRGSLRILVAGGLFGILTLLVVLALLWREIARRQAGEAALQAHRDHLERLVAERTKHLAAANEDLRAEMTLRMDTVLSLRQAEAQLRLLVERTELAKAGSDKPLFPDPASPPALRDQGAA